MKEIGRVRFVQVQRSALKQGEKPNLYYDPAGLLRVDALKLSPAGVMGMNGDGMAIVDIHHKAHPETRAREGNGISIGLSANYKIMRGKFGPHITDGIAGENIIIDCEQTFLPGDLGRDVALEDEQSGERIMFSLAKEVKPCKEFSSFCMKQPLSGELLKETLQFLDNGRRGYFLVPKNGEIQPSIGQGFRFLLGD